jgi:hypothetical protein
MFDPIIGIAKAKKKVRIQFMLLSIEEFANPCRGGNFARENKKPAPKSGFEDLKI